MMFINLPDINWSNTSVFGHSHSFRLNHIFLDFLLHNAVTQIVSTPTRGTNILDIFITNRPSLVETSNTVDGIGDHKAVFVTSLATSWLSHPNGRTIYLWSQVNFQYIRNRISLLVKSLFPLTPHLHLLKFFGTILQVSVILVWIWFLLKFSSPNLKKPWINAYIKRLSRRKQCAYNRACSSI